MKFSFKAWNLKLFEVWADLHPVCGDNVPDVGHHDLGEYLVDEAVVANEARVSDVLHTQTVIWKNICYLE